MCLHVTGIYTPAKVTYMQSFAKGNNKPLIDYVHTLWFPVSKLRIFQILFSHKIYEVIYEQSPIQQPHQDIEEAIMAHSKEDSLPGSS